MFHMSAILPIIGVFDVGGGVPVDAPLRGRRRAADARRGGGDRLLLDVPGDHAGAVRPPGVRPERLRHVRVVNNVAPPDTLRAMQAAHAARRADQRLRLHGVRRRDVLQRPRRHAGAARHDLRAAVRRHGGRRCATSRPARSRRPSSRASCSSAATACSRATTRTRSRPREHARRRRLVPHRRRRRATRRGPRPLPRAHQGHAQGRRRERRGDRDRVLPRDATRRCSIAAVVGVPAPAVPRGAGAFVELRPGHEATAEELLEHCREGLARFKVPHEVHFVTEWPMSATKIQKFRLQEWLASRQIYRPFGRKHVHQ